MLSSRVAILDVMEQVLESMFHLSKVDLILLSLLYFISALSIFLGLAILAFVFDAVVLYSWRRSREKKSMIAYEGVDIYLLRKGEKVGM